MTITGRAAADRESKVRPRVSPKPTAKADLLVLGIAAALATIVLGAQQTPSPPLTAAQAGSGRVVYDARCASCHQPDLRGGGEAPSLSGAGFRSRWLTRSPEELTAYVQAAMPPTGARLSGVDAINVSAFLITTNRTPSGVPAPAALAPPAATVTAKPAPKRGLTVLGHIDNYVPVTEEMLKNPPPGDWLMARRTYQAWSYSPLDQITRANVANLRLAWIWAMNDQDGANQPMPLVHNGIIYLVGTGG
ncbi:MAG TPA: c-type cytochrome, partial [Vicinamibacterales bacterium]|nr:c-type cytochrome [Vicinamibacterales bacterium]